MPQLPESSFKQRPRLTIAVSRDRMPVADESVLPVDDNVAQHPEAKPDHLQQGASACRAR